MQLTLYTIPGSHPCETVEAALALKGLDYDRVDLLPGLSQFQQLVRFGRRTVPGLRVDGYKVVGSPLILRTLEGLAPDPPLYPHDPAARAAVEEAERWGDEQLQEVARWATIYSLGRRRPDAALSFLEGANVPQFPDAVSIRFIRVAFSAELRILGPGVEGTERWLRQLPALLDHADGLVEAGTIGGPGVNAADLHVGASIALLTTLEDLRPALDGRPSTELARRLFPRYPGTIPAGTLPPEWVRATAPDVRGGTVTSAA